MIEIRIGNRIVGPDRPPFIIAEMSGNHNGSLERALEIVHAASAAGASAIKLQTYRPDTITLDSRQDDFLIRDEESLWNGRYLYELYDEAHTPWEWHSRIFQEAADLGLTYFSSPFDETAVDFLEQLDVPAYKIASFEIVHLPLIRKVARTGKPMIISTGLASRDEISEALEVAKSEGNEQIILLKCTSSYPARAEDCNLSTIPKMRQLFGTQVGFSDHTLGVQVSAEAVRFYGATVIEKHFTLEQTQGGVDEDFSLKPNEFENLVSACHRAHREMGSPEDNVSSPAHGVPTFGGTDLELRSLIFRPSIWFAKDCERGTKITDADIVIRRPGFGLPPRHFESIIGKQIKESVNFGDRVTWSSID